MAGIRKWIRGKLDSKPQGKGERQPVHAPQQPMHQDSFPYLPATRPRPLTPEPADGNEKPGSSRFLQNYGLFCRAPYEVRRQILAEAFGGRTLHVDLSYRHPLARKARNAETSRSGSNASAGVAVQRAHRHCDLGSELVPDTSRSQEWQWFGCVCHRRSGYSEIEKEQRYAAMETSQTIEPCDDECLEGSESMCSCQVEQSNSDGAACFVGAMGWLLACRQAYADGIDVLYSTNTFHIVSLDLQLNLPCLVHRHNLGRITSLELLWKLNTIQASKHPIKDHVKPLWDGAPNFQGQPNSPLHVLCDMIPRTFPHLRSLYISFQCWLDLGSPRGGLGGDVISEVETIFLGPVEDMMRAYLLGRSRQEGHSHGHGHGYDDLELNVAIQRGAWRVLLAKYHKLLGAKLKVESVDELSRGRFWKPLRLGSGAAVTGSGGGGAAYEANGDDCFGYWICGGWEDMKVFGNDYWIMTNWGDKWTGTKDTF